MLGFGFAGLDFDEAPAELELVLLPVCLSFLARASYTLSLFKFMLSDC